MKTIELTQGQVAIIDDEDFDLVNQFKWTAQKIVQKNKVVYYAKRTVWIDWKGGKQKTLLLHRFIIDAAGSIQVDHRNRDPLDCRRENLRLATQSQNLMNKGPHRPNMYKGVEFRPKSGEYFASITHEGKVYRLGLYSTADTAAKAYDLKAKELFGEFAYLNFPERIYEIFKDHGTAALPPSVVSD